MSRGAEAAVNPHTGAPYSSRYWSILKARRRLPVYEHQAAFVSLLAQHQCIVLVGETGSGKTTQIPSFMIEAGVGGSGRGAIACTQPRRVAAMSVARRVAEEMDVTLGAQVGYAIRFEDCTSQNTLLKYMTDGVLLREAMADPTLRRYSAVVIDEAHERTVCTDLLLGLLKRVCARRPDLKLVVMSATLDAAKFQDFLGGAPLLAVPGRLHPVAIYHTVEPVLDYVDSAISTVKQIHIGEGPGDVLVFLTGEAEIDDACRRTSREVDKFGARAGPVLVVPLYSTLPLDKQRLIFEPPPPPRSKGGPPGRKIIFATNIAETSLTIDGIVYVVDPGFSKQKVYNPRIRVESLLVSPISKASAKQRAGRAGRTRPGKCFRLYTRPTYRKELLPQSYPEILRSSLASVVLQLKRLGIDDLVHFDFIDPPAPETLMRALESLYYLDALDADANLTQTGKRISDFPLEPPLAASLLAAGGTADACVDEMLTIAAMLSVPSPFQRPREAIKQADEARAKFEDPTSDHVTLLNLWTEWRRRGENSQWAYENFVHARSLKTADSIRSQLSRMIGARGGGGARRGRGGAGGGRADGAVGCSVRRCLLAGHFMQSAHLCKGGKGATLYTTAREDQLVALHPSSALRFTRPDWIIYHEVQLTSKTFVRTATQVEAEWLLELAPRYFRLAPSAAENGGAALPTMPQGAARRSLEATVAAR